MTTVTEFKDLGVEFIKGDKGETFHVHYAEGFNRQKSCFNGDKVTRFAWRPLNTMPDNPKFKYEVDTGIHSWRPLLDQSEVEVSEDKPVFTQAMADAGELPPVGSRCLAVYKVGVETYEIEVTVAHINGNQVACIDTNNDYRIQYTDSAEYFKPIDTRTPKQKAVDELSDDLLSAPRHLNSKGVAEILVKLGYRKC